MTFPEPGTRFFQVSWVGTIAFVVTAGAAATSPSTFELAAVAVSLTILSAVRATLAPAYFQPTPKRITFQRLFLSISF